MSAHNTTAAIAGSGAVNAGITLEHDWFPRPVPANVVMGARSWLYSSYAFLHYRSRMPVGVRIGHDTGVYIETHFDVGPMGQVLIGDFCTLAGPIISTNSRVTIGSYVLISREVVIADGPFAAPCGDGARGAIPAAPAGDNADVIIGDNVWIGARAVLLGGASIGEGAIIGAAAVVDFVVPPFAIVAGNPARIVGSAPPRSTTAPCRASDSPASRGAIA